MPYAPARRSTRTDDVDGEDQPIFITDCPNLGTIFISIIFIKALQLGQLGNKAHKRIIHNRVKEISFDLIQQLQRVWY